MSSIRNFLFAVVSAAAAVALANNDAQVSHLSTMLGVIDSKKVGAIFKAWNTSHTPGCMLGVLKNGRTIYSRGYGMADIEHDVPITADTVFNTGSMAKQFTAFAIHMLAQEGKLSLDEDIRKYVPELHDFSKTITIRHLLHHTSGMRDQGNLLLMAGWRWEDVMAEGDILHLLSRQNELNFAPGEEELYSNSNYTLLAVMVNRITGKSLRDFAQERIFGPLGMAHTLFRDDHGFLVKNRALSYQPQVPGIYRYIALSYMSAGSTSLYTTIDDLARWDENFYDRQVGGAKLIAAMEAPGQLNSGLEISYASGLYWGKYRGIKTVEHGGADAGYRANLLRFPERHFSVALLCNAGDADPVELTRRVADIYLAGDFKSGPEVSIRDRSNHAAEVKLPSKLLDSYVGDYELGRRVFVTFARDNDRLTMEVIGERTFSLVPSSTTSFFLKGASAEVIFDQQKESGKSVGFTMRQDDGDRRAKRIPHERPRTELLQRYAGSFYSEELNAIYTVFVRNGRLLVNYPRGINEMHPATLTSFVTGLGAFTYACTQDGQCNSFTVDNDRVRNLRFVKVDLRLSAAPK